MSNEKIKIIVMRVRAKNDMRSGRFDSAELFNFLDPSIPPAPAAVLFFFDKMTQ